MRISYLTLALVLMPLPVFASSENRLQPLPKMHHMMVVPDAPVTPALATPAPADATPAQPEAKAEEPVAEKKPLTPEEALVKPDALKDWPGMTDVVTLSNAPDIDKMIKTVEAEPGVVPPAGLLFLAKALSEKRRFEEAAFYFYAGQLRATFDVARWPPRLSPEDMQRVLAEKKKSPDQQGQTIGANQPRIKNPHESVFMLSTAISGPISSWLFEDPTRADRVLAKVKAWDERTPYAYKPNYSLPEPVPYAEWAKLLPATRDGFFKRMNEFVTGLKKLKSPKP